MKLVFDTRGNEKQKDAARYWIDDTTDEIWYGGSKGSGKSYLGCALIFGDALIYPETFYFIARKKLNDLRRFTIPSIHEVLRDFNVPDTMFKYNGQDNFFEMYNKSKVFLLDARYLPSDPEYQRFGSMQMTRGMIEEAGEFEFDSYSSLAISIGRWKNDVYGLRGKLLGTMNPSKNFVKRMVYDKWKKGDLEDRIKFIQALPDDNKMLPDGYLERLRNTLSRNERERLLYGNWEYDDDPTALVDYDNITSIFENDHVPEGRKYLTADIARLGSDKAVILVWSGWRVIDHIIFEKSRTTDIQNAITALRSKHQIAPQYCIADEDGVGGGVVDNSRIRGFLNNGKVIGKENYLNLQNQCVYYLAEKIQRNEVYWESDLQEKYRDEVIEELEQLKSYQVDKGGKIRALPKEKIKEAIGRSPDWRDALMMRSWFDLAGSRTIKMH